jgi:pyrimidine deaminase RibD-like protein
VIINEILTAPSNDPRDELDAILAQCCELVLNGQESDADFYGMVGACVVYPDGQLVYGINYKTEDGTRVHAERAALERCADIDPKCIVVTTLSPCNRPMDERSGESCEDLVASYGIEHVYCGYKDPTQDNDDSIETHNPKLQELCKRLADTFLDEDYDPNGPPPGPETKPTMPAGTVRVDVSDVYDWYKLGTHISNLKGADKSIFGKGPPSTIISFGSEEEEHKYIKDLERLGLTTTDIDPVDPNQPPGMPRQKTDPTFNVNENFDDGKAKGKSRPGRVKRAGASCSGSVTSLRARAKRASGERAKMYHWCANMKSGRQKNENTLDEKWTKKYKRSINCAHPKGFSQRAHCQGRKKK